MIERPTYSLKFKFSFMKNPWITRSNGTSLKGNLICVTTLTLFHSISDSTFFPPPNLPSFVLPIYISCTLWYVQIESGEENFNWISFEIAILQMNMIPNECYGHTSTSLFEYMWERWMRKKLSGKRISLFFTI